MQHIGYYDSGTGYPVVFLHGFCESNSIWKSLSENLSDEFRIICPDLPGFGESPLPEHPFTLTAIGDTLVAWLKSRGIEQCIVIGHSLGGYIALEILKQYSGFVRAIGLFNSSAFADSEDKKENRNKLIEFIEKNGVKPFLKTFVPSLFYPKTADLHQKTIEAISSKGLLIKPESVMYYAAAMRDREDSIFILEKYRQRILLIAGEYDMNVPLNKSLEMSAILDSGNTHIIPDSAHMSLFEQSELCYEAIRNFVRRQFTTA